MNALTRWLLPYDDLDLFVSSLDDVFTPIFRGAHPLAMDIHETDSAYVIDAALPGMRASDVQVKVQNDVLTISAQARQEGNSSGIRQRSHQQYYRSLRLPEPVDGDNAEGHYENGVLRLKLPKAAQTQAKRITVRSGRNSIGIRDAASTPQTMRWLDPLRRRMVKLLAPLRKAS